jgi:hypothetical protein
VAANVAAAKPPITKKHKKKGVDGLNDRRRCQLPTQRPHRWGVLLSDDGAICPSLRLGLTRTARRSTPRPNACRLDRQTGTTRSGATREGLAGSASVALCLLLGAPSTSGREPSRAHLGEPRDVGFPPKPRGPAAPMRPSALRWHAPAPVPLWGCVGSRLDCLGNATFDRTLRATQDVTVGHEYAADRFTATMPVGRANVLLVDDVWTTASNAQSAAQALKGTRRPTGRFRRDWPVRCASSLGSWAPASA